MKIIIVGTAYPYRGGLAAFNERLALQMKADGHEVEMVTFSLQYPSFLFPGKTQFSTEPDHTGLPISREVNSVNPLSWAKVGRRIARRNPDVVIFAYWMSFMAPCMGSIACSVHRHCGAKVLALVHNMMPHEPSILDKLFPPYFVKQMDGFVALSRSVVEDIEKLDKANRPKAWNPHPIYDHYGELLDKGEAKSLLGLEQDCRYALFFGFIRAYKGLDLLLEAFADSRLRDLGVRLLVAGEFYGDAKPYMDQIERLGIGDRVVLRSDFIPDSEVNRYFSAADIIAQPYKTATQSGVTQIGFHFEKPMLVTNVGGLPEIVPHGKIGYVVEPTPQAIADALVTYYSENREEEFVANVREEKKKYAWSEMTKAFYKVL